MPLATLWSAKRITYGLAPGISTFLNDALTSVSSNGSSARTRQCTIENARQLTIHVEPVERDQGFAVATLKRKRAESCAERKSIDVDVVERRSQAERLLNLIDNHLARDQRHDDKADERVERKQHPRPEPFAPIVEPTRFPGLETRHANLQADESAA